MILVLHCPVFTALNMAMKSRYSLPSTSSSKSVPSSISSRSWVAYPKFRSFATDEEGGQRLEAAGAVLELEIDQLLCFSRDGELGELFLRLLLRCGQRSGRHRERDRLLATCDNSRSMFAFPSLRLIKCSRITLASRADGAGPSLTTICTTAGAEPDIRTRV